MQSLEVISVNLWQILISLCNLLILFLLVRKFLYKPVKKVLSDRQATLDAKYHEAQEAKSDAMKLKADWEERMADADRAADKILAAANESAAAQSRAILDQTNERAERILAQAEADADLERKKAEADIKREIVDVSTALSEKMIGREIRLDDHRELIDEFISKIGDEDDTNK